MRNFAEVILFFWLTLIFTAVPLFGTEDPADARAIYERMRAELASHNTYTCDYEHYTARGPNDEIFAHQFIRGKYIHYPKKYYETTYEAEYSYPDQAGAGYQECYTGSDHLTRMVLPGAYRMLGVVTMFPEDPKVFFINGENLQWAGIWEFFVLWDEMLEGGGIEAEEIEYKGRPHWLLTIRRGVIPDPQYHLVKSRIWIEPDIWFPVHIEYFREGRESAARTVEFKEVKLDAPLEPDDLEFKGMTFGWNLARPPGGEGLDDLQAGEPEFLKRPALDLDEILAGMERALDEIDRYSVTMSMRFRYHRLRLIREDEFSYFREENGFGLETRKLAANYILLGASEGSRMYYFPGREKMIHLLPGGIYRVMGEQTFTHDDPKIFSSQGDNIQELDFFAIMDKVKERQEGWLVKTVWVKASPKNLLMIELKAQKVLSPREPKTMRVMLEPESLLPARVEFRDYDDPEGFCLIEFKNLKINPDITTDMFIF